MIMKVYNLDNKVVQKITIDGVEGSFQRKLLAYIREQAEKDSYIIK